MKISSTNLHYQTVRARKLSPVTCHMSLVIIKKKLIIIIKFFLNLIMIIVKLFVGRKSNTFYKLIL